MKPFLFLMGGFPDYRTIALATFSPTIEIDLNDDNNEIKHPDLDPFAGHRRTRSGSGSE